MTLTVSNTRDLVKPENFNWKLLVYSLSGLGKTEFVTDAPDAGVVACETGEGHGLLTAARKNLDYVVPKNYTEFEQIASGQVFKDKRSLVVDSLSDLCNTIIKDAAIAIPRTSGNSPKRAAGIMELDDYGVCGELTRRVLRKMLDADQHVLVTATLKIKEPDAQSGMGSLMIGPDLPGAMMLGSCAMFDTVMCLKSRSKLRDPKDPKSRYTERYFVTGSDGNGLIAKCRSVVAGGKPLLAQEEIYDIEKGIGTFPYLLAKIQAAYAELFEQQKHPAAVSVAVAAVVK